MEQESLSEQPPNKKGRQRRKQLHSSILQLMEFYFSDANLSKDRFLSQLLEAESSVDINVFLKFNKIRRLTATSEDIVKALKKSTVLTLSEDSLRVSRINPVCVKENIDKCTIYVENIKSDTSHDWLQDLFSDFGKVDYISIPKYKHNRVNKGFAFVEFASEEAASEAIKFFEEIDAKMSLKIAPETLQSIATFEPDENTVSKKDLGDVKASEEVIERSSKRKLKEIDASEESAKRLKTDGAENVSSTVEVKEDESSEKDKKKKSKSKKSKKKSIIKELGLQVLPKNEWKKLRNQYLDMQKKKMKQLKMHLNKRKFSNKYDNRLKTMETPPRLMEAENNALEDEKLKFIPGVIVKFKPFDVNLDAKKLKTDLKSQTTGIKYVDLPHEVGNTEIYVRFSESEQATNFLSSGLSHFGEGSMLDGDDEQVYWSKIKEDRQYKLKKGQTKGRGREKLLKKAERELGKHIRFDDDPDH